MPSEINLTIVRGRNLPVMDMSRNTTDAYCVIKIGKSSHQMNMNATQKVDPNAVD